MTERDVVLRERRAFFLGAQWRFGEALADAPTRNFRPIDNGTIEDAAAREFALPTVTRQRVVEDKGGVQWRFIEGRLEFRALENWFPMLGERGVDSRYGIALFPTPERIAIWADLLAAPTETVDA